jgi:hypothetical protein
MGIFNFFGRQIKPQGFGFKPRYYDEAKEDLEMRLGKHKDSTDPEVMAARLRARFRSKGIYTGSYQNSSQTSNKRLVGIIAILGLIAVLIMKSQRFLDAVQRAYE